MVYLMTTTRHRGRRGVSLPMFVLFCNFFFRVSMIFGLSYDLLSYLHLYNTFTLCTTCRFSSFTYLQIRAGVDYTFICILLLFHFVIVSRSRKHGCAAAPRRSVLLPYLSLRLVTYYINILLFGRYVIVTV